MTVLTVAEAKPFLDAVMQTRMALEPFAPAQWRVLLDGQPTGLTLYRDPSRFWHIHRDGLGAPGLSGSTKSGCLLRIALHLGLKP